MITMQMVFLMKGDKVADSRNVKINETNFITDFRRKYQV